MMRCLKTISRDNARTPVQWDDSDNGGFTTGIPWIKVNPNYREINARAELADSDSVFHYYRKLIALRKQHDIIVYGAFVGRLEDSGSVYAYERHCKGRRLLVACNFTDQTVPCDAAEEFPGAKELICNY